jgi:hypothetical protein
MENITKNKLRINNEKIHAVQREYNKLTKTEEQLKLEKEQEIQKIEMLEQKIKEKNEDNKKRENELEDRLRNHQYLYRKKKD